MAERVPDEYFDELLGRTLRLLNGPKPPRQAITPTKGQTALHRLQVALVEAQMVSEAPSARAYDDIRIAGTKPEAIQPKATGESLSDWMLYELTGIAERFEFELAKRRVRPPRGDDGLTVEQRWKNFALRMYQRNEAGDSIRYLAMIEREKKAAIEKAIAYGRKLSRQAA